MGDNTSVPTQTALSVQQFLVKNSMTPVLHPPYLPDPSPSDFFLFPWMKNVLKGKYFADAEEVKQKMAEALRRIQINEFRNCFEQWKKCLDSCIVLNGE